MGTDVDVIFGADSTKARKEMAKLRKDMSKIIKKNKELESVSKKAGKSQVKTFSDVRNKVSGLAKNLIGVGGLLAAYKLITSEVRSLIEQTKILNQLKQTATVSFDEVFTKALVQGNIGRNSADAKFLKNKSFSLADKFGVNVKDIARAITEFQSQGGTVKQIKEGVLDEIVATAKATNASSVVDVIKPIVLTNELRGIAPDKLTAKQARRSGVRLTSAFSNTLFQSKDAQDLAGFQALAARAGINEDQAISLFIQSKKQTGGKAEKAVERATIFVRELINSPGNKEKQSIFKKMKIDPEKVDFIAGKDGKIESVESVQRLLFKGMMNLPPKERVKAISGLFGADAFKETLGLIMPSSVDKQIDISRNLNDETGFNKKLSIATSGPNFVQTKLENAKIRNNISTTLTVEQQKEIIKSAIVEAGNKAIISDTLVKQIRGRIDTFSGLGEAFSTPEAIAKLIVGATVLSDSDRRVEVKDLISNNLRQAESEFFKSNLDKQTKAKEKQADAIVTQTEIIQNNEGSSPVSDNNP
ncbi:MAG: hypothetical protein COA79_21010 [Planctomycetota bacterium]|nr:MAG: hypothetical protein COA79_21010 [Planctomycetota bacterium]